MSYKPKSGRFTPLPAVPGTESPQARQLARPPATPSPVPARPAAAFVAAGKPEPERRCQEQQYDQEPCVLVLGGSNGDLARGFTSLLGPNSGVRVLSGFDDESARIVIGQNSGCITTVIADHNFFERYSSLLHDLLKRRLQVLMCVPEQMPSLRRMMALVTSSTPGMLAELSAGDADDGREQLILFDDMPKISDFGPYPQRVDECEDEGAPGLIPGLPESDGLAFPYALPPTKESPEIMLPSDTRSLEVLFAGLGEDIIPPSQSDPRGRGRFDGFVGAHGIDASIAYTLKRMSDMIARPETPPDVLVLGHNLQQDGGAISPLEAIDHIVSRLELEHGDSKRFDGMKIIVVYSIKDVNSEQEEERLAGELDALLQLRNQHDGFRVILLWDSEVPQEVQSRLIREFTADEYMEAGCVPARLLKRIFELIQRMDLPQAGKCSRPPEAIVCSFKGPLMRDERSAEEVRRLMDFFARYYVPHMKSTGHFSAQHQVMMALQSHFGTSILDAGCGPGYVMRRFIREAWVPRFQNGTRPFTRILSVDNSRAMLELAMRKAKRMMGYDLMKEGGAEPGSDLTLKRYLLMHFHEQDFLKLTPEELAGIDFPAPDTVLASYFISWIVGGKPEAVAKLYELLPPGGKLVTMEEVKQTVTSSDFMVPELALGITSNIEPVESLDVYYGMLMAAGFRPVGDADLIIPIDPPEIASQKKRDGLPPHEVRGKVFEK